MIRKSFKMKLYPGMEKEYEKRHNQLWPEMRDMIHEYGGSNYSIFLDKDTDILYGYIELEDAERWDKSADTEICHSCLHNLLQNSLAIEKELFIF